MIPVNHMVAPADQALDCLSCHARDGLLAQLPGGLVPGRDGFAWLDWLGLAILGRHPCRRAAPRPARIGFRVFHRGPRHG